MTEFNTGFPSVRQIQSFIKNKTTIEVSVVNSEKTLKGVIQWQDQNCLFLLSEQQEQTLIWFQAVVYIKKRS